MHLIILPGNSKQYNEQGLYDSARHFGDLFESVTLHVYEHWKTGTGEEMADTKLEAEKLEKEASALNGDYVIYAKSIGTITTIRAHVENGVSPKKCVFVGSPFENAGEELIGLATQFKIPTLFIQQTDDMFFKHADLEKFLNEHWTGEYKLIEIPGGNHAYDNYEDVKAWISEFLA